jgi:hypothetical protein
MIARGVGGAAGMAGKFLNRWHWINDIGCPLKFELAQK